MYNKKECVAMLLAGGQGSRLYTLTEKTAKPAVPFGAKYRKAGQLGSQAERAAFSGRELLRGRSRER